MLKMLVVSLIDIVSIVRCLLHFVMLFVQVSMLLSYSCTNVRQKNQGKTVYCDTLFEMICRSEQQSVSFLN